MWRPTVAAALAAAVGSASLGTAPTVVGNVDVGNPLQRVGGHGVETRVEATPSGCPAVAACERVPNCTTCLAAVGAAMGARNASAVPSVNTDPNASRWFDKSFFDTLVATPTCAAGGNITTLTVMAEALLAIHVDGDCSNDSVNLGVGVSHCDVYEFQCFAENTGTCRDCFAQIVPLLGAFGQSHSGGSSGNAATVKAEILGSPTCIGNESTYFPLVHMAVDCVAAFPGCTFLKLLCESLPECASCLRTLRRDDAAGAAACASSSSQLAAATIDFVSLRCVGGGAYVAWGYWYQRCSDEPGCGPCRDALLGAVRARSRSAIGAAALSTECAAALANATVRNYLHVLFGNLQISSKCISESATCAVSVTGCAECLAHAAPYNSSTACAPDCDALLETNGITAACVECPEPVKILNRIVLATVAVGGASAIACIEVVAALVAFRRDVAAMRDRVVIGLMLANALYSTASVVPVGLLSTTVAKCGQYALPFPSIRAGRAAWFGGKYALVCYEVFISGASAWALSTGGRPVRPSLEALAHAACWGVGLATMWWFYACATAIGASGFNSATEQAAEVNKFSNLGANDAVDDDGTVPENAAAAAFESGRDDYDALVKITVVAWQVLLAAAVAAWLALRVAYRRVLAAWRARSRQMAEAEAADEWADTRRSQWRARSDVMLLQLRGFRQIAGPLEPYVLIFFLFGAPAALMATNWCARDSAAHSAGRQFGTENRITYGFCDATCELVLSFRSLATVAAYMVISAERRREYLDVAGTWRRVWRRAVEFVRRCLRWGAPPQTGYVAVNGGSDDDDSGGGDDDDDLYDERWLIVEEDIHLEVVIGQGGFGTVWRGTLKPAGGGAVDSSASPTKVAVKMLHAARLDEEGDVVDPSANEEFQKECAAVRRLRHVNLVSFIGYGTTSKGIGFIVTEFMQGGSLSAALHDRDVAILWRTRASYALQVAAGMAHLHGERMLHRDLKSENILLDGQGRAVVADFGLSRRLRRRPAAVAVAVSSFTGERSVVSGEVAVSVARVDNGGVGGGGGGAMVPAQRLVATLTSIGPNGKMTKAAGTILWMAPEMFRGDTTYTVKIDVWSFGVVMWELATRALPWSELGNGNDQMRFFEALNRALQTGRRPVVPGHVTVRHPEFVAVMRRCWASDPADRPRFCDVVPRLAACLRHECAASACE